MMLNRISWKLTLELMGLFLAGVCTGVGAGVGVAAAVVAMETCAGSEYTAWLRLPSLAFQTATQ